MAEKSAWETMLTGGSTILSAATFGFTPIYGEGDMGGAYLTPEARAEAEKLGLPTGEIDQRELRRDAYENAAEEIASHPGEYVTAGMATFGEAVGDAVDSVGKGAAKMVWNALPWWAWILVAGAGTIAAVYAYRVYVRPLVKG